MAAIAGLGVNAVGLGQSAYGSIAGVEGIVKFYDPNSPKEVAVKFDAALTEAYTTEATPTKFPVEGGNNISDHIIREPVSLKISAIVSDTPLHDLRALLTAAGLTAGSAVANALGVGPLGVAAAGVAAMALDKSRAGAKAPSRAAYATLLRLQNGDTKADPPKPPKPFVVVTKLGKYENMVITSLGTTRDASTGDALIFEITLANLMVVAPQSVNVAIFKDPAAAAALQEQGDKSADEAFNADAVRQQAVQGRIDGLS